MTTTAALFSQPAARPAAGESKAAPAKADASRADQEEFAKLLDTEIDDTDANTAQQPVPAATVALQPVAEPVLAEGADLPTQTDASAVAAFETALAGLSAETQAAPAASDTDVTAAPVTTDASDTQTVPAASAQTAATPAATAAVTTVMILAGATSPAGKIATGKPTTEADTLGGDTGETEAATVATPDAPQAAPILATAIAQPQVSDTVAAATDATAKPAAPIGAPAAPATPELPAPPAGPGKARTDAADQPQAAIADAAKPTQPAHAAAQATASAAPQANAQTPAAAADVAAPAIADAGATAAAASTASAQPAATSEAAKAAATPAALQLAPAATIQVYSRIIERADGRAQRFEVRLDPAELGRVDVRIEIGADKKVHAVLAAHDSAALTDLMRGQRALERALTDAGLDLSDKGVSFELSSDSGRGNASQQREGDASNRSSSQNVWRGFETTTMPATAEAAAIARQPWQTQRYDLVA